MEVLRNQVETPNLDPNPNAQFVAGLHLPCSLLKLELSNASGRRRNEAEGRRANQTNILYMSKQSIFCGEEERGHVEMTRAVNKIGLHLN